MTVFFQYIKSCNTLTTSDATFHLFTCILAHFKFSNFP
ncbi:hypothetical protein AVDCRST_MAG84-6377 [uncultured Microcoleus sp.]|uniref:Uncharacterized protein n=1 Tax=uncultured Microcoleus sp. TaxID=259945 RepID=A0A6J4P6V2_9CYAN|nr:hypothetical protein AVDCRST_MAG84-6377 [uncultured Microcoleus sp.]